MAKAAVGYVNSVFGTVGSAGTVVVFVPHKNPDGSAVKDTRT